MVSEYLNKRHCRCVRSSCLHISAAIIACRNRCGVNILLGMPGGVVEMRVRWKVNGKFPSQDWPEQPVTLRVQEKGEEALQKGAPDRMLAACTRSPQPPTQQLCLWSSLDLSERSFGETSLGAAARGSWKRYQKGNDGASAVSDDSMPDLIQTTKIKTRQLEAKKRGPTACLLS